jgi:hypothetical protein
MKHIDVRISYQSHANELENDILPAVNSYYNSLVVFNVTPIHKRVKRCRKSCRHWGTNYREVYCSNCMRNTMLNDHYNKKQAKRKVRG